MTSLFLANPKAQAKIQCAISLIKQKLETAVVNKVYDKHTFHPSLRRMECSSMIARKLYTRSSISSKQPLSSTPLPSDYTCEK